MDRTRSARKSGFTLVEILIVVIILGILAAIVIPQFTNASQDARKNSLTSQLQTIRSQLELYKMQHKDQLPDELVGSGSWDQLVKKSNVDHGTADADADKIYGPYLQAPPVNPLNGSSLVFVVGTGGTEPVAGANSGATNEGWVLSVDSGKIYATSAKFSKIYDEADPSAATNEE